MQILIIGVVAHWFASLSGIPTYIKHVLFKFGIKKKININESADVTFGNRYDYIQIRLYPFDCEKCLAFWIGLLYFPFTFDGVLYSCCASFVAILTLLLINKLR